MKLYKLSQNENTGYDTYDSMVVCAKDADEARNIHPENYWKQEGGIHGVWCMPEKVKVEYIGEAASNVAAGVVCASFNPG